MTPITAGVLALGGADPLSAADAIPHDADETPCSVDEFARGAIRPVPGTTHRGHYQMCAGDLGSPTGYRWWTV